MQHKLRSSDVGGSLDFIFTTTSDIARFPPETPPMLKGDDCKPIELLSILNMQLRKNLGHNLLPANPRPGGRKQLGKVTEMRYPTTPH
jgi:hypothetical protein